MPSLRYLPAEAPCGSPSCPTGTGAALRLDWLQRTLRAESWRARWRPRALAARVLHERVPGLEAGPGFELLGDPRGPGWLEFRAAEERPHDPDLELQRLLEVTRRPWGLLALLPREARAPVRLLERERNPGLGRRLASAAAERLLAGRRLP
ncbi:MAG: hypothetical protein WD341_15240 [Tistlia sp.]|uniref:hypothetical protein n=1 Tax=Tistlia sp. TaxID=3057121 RepID=UPI0034A1684C